MPACPREDEYSALPPPGFTGNNCISKSAQLIQLLEKVIEKYRCEPYTVEQRAKQTDLLLSIAQYTILAGPISNEGRRSFLQQIVSLGGDLLAENQQSPEESPSFDSSSPSNENSDTAPSASNFTTPNKENDEDFSLDDLASEYLQDEPTSTEKPVPDDISSKAMAPGPFSVLSSLILQPIPTDSIVKSPLELILFSNQLSSHDAAADADAVCTDKSSSLGQMFCEKMVQTEMKVKKRVPSCLLDRTLYERLTRLITLLPKQCPIVSYPSVDRRGPNPRYSEGPRKQRPEFHPRNRPDFTQRNDVPRPRPPPNFAPYPQHYNGPAYPDQMRSGNPPRYRHPQQPPLLRPNQSEQQYQARGPPKNHGPRGPRPPPQQNRRNPEADPSDDHPYQRGPKNNSGGNKTRPNPR